MTASRPPSAGAGSRTAFASRAVVATAIGAAFAGLAWADAVGLGDARPAWWLLPVAIFAAARGAAEYSVLFARAGVAVRGRLAQAATVVVAVSAAAGAGATATGREPASPVAALGWTAVACMLSAAVLAAAELPGYRPGARRLEALAGGIFAVVGLGLPLAFMIALRLVDPGSQPGGATHLGILPLASLVAVVKAGDIAAYVCGTLCGRHRMAPVLSPGKTWEGAAASLAASVAASWFVLERVAGARPGPAGGWLAYGVVVGIAGMVGDLAESFVKRELGAKDSGRLLGGLGGVLDLVDSLLLAAPLAWLMWVVGRP